MRPISESTARIADKNFSRKYIAIGRIIKQWSDIMGKDFANKAHPLKINYRKSGKTKKATATLDIATNSSYATILPYQKGIILERINRLFGDNWISDIRFVVSDITEPTPNLNKKAVLPLTNNEKNYLSNTLNQINDPELKKRLENLGKAILTDLKTTKERQ